MRLWLVRHGQSVANQRKLVTGTPLDPLAPEGRHQAMALREMLNAAALEADLVVCSPWLRAKQTAELASPSSRLVLDERIGETDAGQVADLPLADFIEMSPDFYGDAANTYPGGESHLDLDTRVHAWVNELQSLGHEEVLAICHSGPICCLMQRALGIPMTNFPALLPAHASLSMIEYGVARPEGQVKLFSQVSDRVLKQIVSARK